MKKKIKSKNKISACLVVYHDEGQIERCLKSIKDVVDEIIIIHDGPCKDKTLEIAKKYTKKVYEGKRLGNPEPHRVDSFKKATGNWILVIDADEFLSTELKNNLRRLVDTDQADGYFFLWRLWDGKKYITKNWPHRIGVVKKEKLSFLAILHPEWRVLGKLINVQYHLEHRPSYNNFTLQTFRTKWIRWMKLHAEQIMQNADSIPQFNYQRKTFPKHIEWVKKYHIFAAPFLFCYILAGSFLSAPVSDWKNAYKFFLLQSLYYFLLCFFLFRLRFK